MNYITSKTVITRPSISVPFKTDFPDMPGQQYSQYIKDTYIKTGKMLSSDEGLSEDLLTLSIHVVWKNDEERLAYREDPIVKKCFEFMIDYRKKNGMTMDWYIKEYDGVTNALISERSGSFI